jgi:hypothetical protein
MKRSYHRALPMMLGMLAAALVWCSGAAHAQQLKPGDVITPQNAAKVRDLVSPGVMHVVEHGMQMVVAPTKRVDWPPPYREATEKYSAQVQLSANHKSLVGYVAGQPFPLLDANDPYVATKIMWNNTFRPISTDDYDLRFFECQYQYENTSPSKIFYQQLGHYAGYANIGRTEVEPMPTDPDFKTSGVMYYFAIYPVLSPMDQRGTGFVRWRYLSPNEGDAIWTYQGHQSRRVRRLNEGIMSSAASEAEIFDPDHYSGFNAKNEEYNYKFLGERNMLACVHATTVPARTCKTDGGSSICPENWEIRHLYVVEATPNDIKASQALHSKTIVFVDSEMWFNPYVDIYDRAGRLWNSTIYWLTCRDRPVPDAKVAIYPFEREFVVAAGRTDMQSNYSEVCYLPGHETPERECWYINMGAVDRQFFTVDALVRAAQD